MGVIFDLDGVLVDTSKYHKQAWFDLAEREGINISDELFRTTFGMQNYQILAKLTGRELPTEEIDRMSEWKENRYRQLVADCKLVLMDGVKPLLDDLPPHVLVAQMLYRVQRFGNTGKVEGRQFAFCLPILHPLREKIILHGILPSPCVDRQIGTG